MVVVLVCVVFEPRDVVDRGDGCGLMIHPCTFLRHFLWIEFGAFSLPITISFCIPDVAVVAVQVAVTVVGFVSKLLFFLD